jgi:hypothetical protein
LFVEVKRTNGGSRSRRTSSRSATVPAAFTWKSASGASSEVVTATWAARW